MRSLWRSLIGTSNWAAYLLGGVAAATLFGVCLLPKIGDSNAYFNFADHRTIFGVPCFMDVISNVPFAIVGVAGLLQLIRFKAATSDWELKAFAALFGAVLLISAGSAYFHLSPSPERLVWDRLPMSIAFMSILAIAIGDRLHRRLGCALFLPSIVAGIGSVLYGHAGQGDLRFYLWVQFFPVVALSVLTFIESRYTGKFDYVIVVVFYACAKALELWDAPVFKITAGYVSGHTLKHLVSAMGAAWLLRISSEMLRGVVRDSAWNRLRRVSSPVQHPAST